ncbi:Vacuolar cation-chloride cotransporter 1 [Candida viswanathii]|uniref:Vacuolar cation-chloride cotransporter 1 n=1 Tax=Candida viswanathii TaxID=5486 RepID=A0A367XUR8_9ASCO|nr:Vacuolar cation-chloride cotransporter 1 [Candida viswanathii]
MAISSKRSPPQRHPLPTIETSPLLSTKKSNQHSYTSNSRGDEKTDLKNKHKVERNLGTFEGVFLPTSLNVLSILMFLRFGFIIGQMGILGTLFLLVLSYTIDVLTTLSISAISTNGTVKGGGAYYMISRSLGPEFGGAIGIIFVIGQILNSSLNVVGFIEPLLVNFGYGGDMANLLPVSYLWLVLYSTILLAICTGVAMVGSLLVSKTALFLFIILTISTVSIPISTLFVKPYYPLAPPYQNILYTGLSWKTLTENLYPHFTSGAAGSVLPPGQKETFTDLFGIFFPATAGILAGASMLGELKNPSKSIPRGTLRGLLVTFFLYISVIVSMGAAIPRELLYVDIKVIQTVNMSDIIIILGEFSTSLFSVIMGIVGAATMINAIADDKIIPGLSVFTTSKKSIKEKKKAQIYSIIATWFIAQLFLFADINQIATFITMAFLMTFIVTNIACFLLKVGSAPNFRPSFRYFSSRTAFTGALVCLIAMFIVDGLSATLVIFCLTFLILTIHYLTPPSKFGDISQLLIYHQVRKYLLRLKLEMSVKYWRPQILLLCDDPRSCWNLIGFCNHLKKGGLYVLGHVVLMNDDTNPSCNTDKNSRTFSTVSYQEVRKQKQAWIKLRDMSKIKAFVQIALGPTLPWGVRNVYLGSGLGGMKPNITVLGFYDFKKHGISLPILPVYGNKPELLGQLPTDRLRKERKVSINQWVQIVEDLIVLQATVAVAANFTQMQLPRTERGGGLFKLKKAFSGEDEPQKYIDLYPIQMSSVAQLENGQSVLSTNFDTCTLILQLGSILSTVDEWELNDFKVRVIVFVEYSLEVEDERERLSALLSSLRIDAEIKVICLEDEGLASYNYMVKGFSKSQLNKSQYDKIDKTLAGDQWWKNLTKAREALREVEKRRTLCRQKLKLIIPSRSPSRSSLGPETFYPLNLNASSPTNVQLQGIKNNRRYTMSNLQEQGMSLSFNLRSAQTNNDNLLYTESVSDTSDSESEDTGSLTASSSATNLASARNSGTNLAVSHYSLDRQPPQNTKESTKYKNAFNEQLQRTGVQALDQISIRSSISNLRPNFLSVKMPNAKVNDDAEDGDDQDEEDEDEEHDVVGGGDEKRVSMKDRPKQSIQFVDDEDADGANKESKTTSGVTQVDKRTQRGPSKTRNIIANDDEIIQHITTPQFLAVDEDEEDEVNVPPMTLRDSATSQTSSSRADFYKNRPTLSRTQSATEKTITKKQLQDELKNLSFNDIPAKGQHLVLNELMARNSPADQTLVIFSTLPAPPNGTHLDDNDSFDYTNNLAIWLDGLPPVLLLNSQTVTVTTAL